MRLAGEDLEQSIVVKWLESCNKYKFCHVPNGGYRRKAEGAKLKVLGVRAGVPDLLIFTGMTAIEMKRKKPEPSRISKGQREWLAALTALGWNTRICYGAEEAIAWLESLGYD